VFVPLWSSQRKRLIFYTPRVSYIWIGLLNNGGAIILFGRRHQILAWLDHNLLYGNATYRVFDRLVCVRMRREIISLGLGNCILALWWWRRFTDGGFLDMGSRRPYHYSFSGSYGVRGIIVFLKGFLLMSSVFVPTFWHGWVHRAWLRICLCSQYKIYWNGGTGSNTRA